MQNQDRINPKVTASVFATGLLSFSGVIVETSMNVSFPTLMNTFHVNTATVQWMTTLYMLVVAIIVPLSSVLKRSFKTKSLFLVANLLFILGLIMDALAPNFGVLLLGRMIQGFGTGIALPLMFNIILEQVPAHRIGTMMGIGTLITAIAPAIGPTFGGLVVNSLGWRFIFLLLLPILIISLLLGLFCIQQKSTPQRTHFDLISIIALILMFSGLIFGFSNMGSQPLLSLSVLGAFIVGILGIFLFIGRSLHIDDPIIQLTSFTNLKFTGHVISFFFFQLASLGLSFIIPNYIQLVNGNTATTAGLIVLPGAALGAILAPFSGRILDSFGARSPILIGSGCTLIAVILLSVFTRHLPNVAIIFIYLIFMMGAGLAFGNIMTNGINQLKSTLHSDGNAIMNTLQQFAGATGTSIVATIISQSQSTLSGSKAVTTAIGSQHAFIVLTVLVLIELLILTVVTKTSKNEETK